MSRTYQQFLKLDETRFKNGEYLVMVNGKVVKHGRRLKKLLAEARKEYPNKTPYIAKVPAEGALILPVCDNV